MTIHESIGQMIFSKLITIEDIKGKEEKVIEIVRNAEVEGLREMVRIMESGSLNGCFTTALEATRQEAATKIKAL